MKKIAIFQNDLGVGGIQKSLINLLKNFDYSAAAVDLYLSENDEYRKVDFPEQLNIRFLPKIPRIYSFMPFELSKALCKPDFSGCEEYDLAIDFNSYQFSCALGALSVPAKKRVMWVHNDVEIKLRNEWKYRVLWHFFKGKFRYFDEFVCVSEALAEPFKKMSGISDKEFTVIQNYVDVDEIHKRMYDPVPDLIIDESCINFVTVGRLCHQKGYDLMLDYFKTACESREDLRLYFIGDGPERRTLERLRDEYRLSDKVYFLGSKTNPFSYMNKMDAFLSTSRYEGQGINILEALAVGLPVYITKNLEQYTGGIEGCEDIVKAMLNTEKGEKQPLDLSEYNNRALNGIALL